MSEKYVKYTPFIKQCLVTTSTCCSVISACGCAMGFPGILLPQLQSPESGITLTDDQASWIASVDNVPMFFGNWVVPVIMTHAGRRPAHIATILATLSSWVIIILANSFEVMLVGRILQGAALGMMMPLRSVLVSEYTSPRYRGAFLTVTALGQTVGIFLVHVIGSFMTYRITALVAMLFSIVGLLIAVYAPETPSWLATKGQYDKCRKNFVWLRSPEETPELETMLLATMRLDESTKERKNLKDKLAFAKRKEFYKPIILMCALFTMANFTSSTLVIVYPMIILRALMGIKANSQAWLVALDVQCIVFSIVAVYVIHKVKRRTLLFTTGGVTAGLQLVLAGYVLAKNKNWLPFDSMWISGVIMSIQMAASNIGFMPLCCVLSGEVFPLKFRSYCESISLLALYLSVFVVVKTFLYLFSAVGIQGVFGLYSGVMFLCLAVMWVLLPETSGRTLLEIEEHFRGAPLADSGAHIKEIELLNKSEEVTNSPSDQDNLTNLS